MRAAALAGSGLSAGALLLACEGDPAALEQKIPQPAGMGGAAGSGGVGGAAGSGGVGGTIINPSGGTAGGVFSQPIIDCEPVDVGMAIFAGDGIATSVSTTWPREFFSWTTPEQLEELRTGKVLFTRTEREGMGPGFAMESLKAFANGESAATEAGQVAKLLSGDLLAKARYAWPHAWATRMGWPGETYGNQLIRFVLREDAWIARFDGTYLAVFDLQNKPILTADVLATPERIAGFLFVKSRGLGGPYCGTFLDGGNGYREFVIGNEAMIEEWSVGTEEMLARLDADIDKLGAFFERTRSCPETRDALSWNLRVSCELFSSSPEQSAYEQALAMPSPAYLPVPASLAELIATLKSDRFTPEPLIVRPGEN